jgi:hypothetical protein
MGFLLGPHSKQGKRPLQEPQHRDVIPGGLTPYLQAGDIGIYREFKDKLSNLIDRWKKSDGVQYT